MGSILNLNNRPAPQYFAYTICDPDTPNFQLKINPDGSINVRIELSTITPLGFQQISNPTVATNLTPPAGATMAQIEVDSILTSGAVRWRDDGTSPTGSVGMLRVPGQEFSYNGNLSAIQFINVSNANPSTLNVTYYQ